MNIRTAALAALLPLLACPVPPKVLTGNSSATPLLADTKKHLETATAVMPPNVNPKCPDGRVFVVYGRQNGASRMASTNLNCYLSNAANCFTQQTFNELSADTFPMTNVAQWDGTGDPQSFTCNGTLAPLQTVTRDIVWYTDSLITRVAKQDLLHAYLTMAMHIPTTPVPNRLNKNAPVGCNNPFTTCSLAIVKSGDCGNTWTKTTVFDLNDPSFMNGTWAVPEYDANGNANQMGYAIDRPEIWVDPYFPFPSKSAVFLSAAIRLGPQAGKTMIVKSLNGGDSWLDPVLLPGTNPGNGGNPTVIATTPNNRVYAFRCVGTEPTLYWSDDYGATFKEKDVRTLKYAESHKENGVEKTTGPLDCGVASASDLAGGVAPGSPSVGIARWGNAGRDNVIVTYSAVLDKMQVQPVMLITTRTPHDEDPLITSNILIRGAKNHSVLQATVVSTDRFEFAPDENNDPLYDATMIYWLDVPAATESDTQATARFMTVRRGLLWNDAQQLAMNNGASDLWNWNLAAGDSFIGDYNRGGFFYANQQLNFAGTWPQSTPGATPNLLLHSNVVTWPEP
jgi:hypothetical protein